MEDGEHFQVMVDGLAHLFKRLPLLDALGKAEALLPVMTHLQKTIKQPA